MEEELEVCRRKLRSAKAELVVKLMVGPDKLPETELAAMARAMDGAEACREALAILHRLDDYLAGVVSDRERELIEECHVQRERARRAEKRVMDIIIRGYSRRSIRDDYFGSVKIT